MAIFVISIIPFNLFHKHEIDGHRFAKVSKEIIQHNCSFDSYVCQVSLLSECHHRSHLAKEEKTCNFCHFQFIKIYNFESSLLGQLDKFLEFSFLSFRPQALCESELIIDNKSPPSI